MKIGRDEMREDETGKSRPNYNGLSMRGVMYGRSAMFTDTQTLSLHYSIPST